MKNKFLKYLFEISVLTIAGSALVLAYWAVFRLIFGHGLSDEGVFLLAALCVSSVHPAWKSSP